LTRHTLLYTEMLTTGALIHGNAAQHLMFNKEEHPVALQLGGSEPADLAVCAKLGQDRGYDEINLNCGCPSERVLKGAFGACLMGEAALVRDCVKAMVDAVDVPVTVKHRIGIDKVESYDFVRDFVGAVAEGGCRVFLVHARNAWLKGLSPKENREIPPLKYPYVYRLKQDFPELTILINGGIADWPSIDVQLAHVDGVMIGREAYHNPWLMVEADRRLFGDDHPLPTRREVIEGLMPFLASQIREGVPLKHMTRHVLGLYQGVPGAKAWRRTLSDPLALRSNDPGLLLRAADALEEGLLRAA
ncbi:MAG: tRNA dihydrouridine(20/20a) synthase DusA, partial [Rhodocyclaceae bacterium]|nr:tRNA dihydrouridine(20/20a) synthase DusA [Rhodocyclaceae bacterium]